MRSLPEVEIGIGTFVALNQSRTVVEDGDIPADRDLVRERRGVGAADEIEDLWPQRESASQNLSASIRMPLAPAGS